MIYFSVASNYQITEGLYCFLYLQGIRRRQYAPSNIWKPTKATRRDGPEGHNMEVVYTRQIVRCIWYTHEIVKQNSFNEPYNKVHI
jgi:hypothetical protein